MKILIDLESKGENDSQALDYGPPRICRKRRSTSGVGIGPTDLSEVAQVPCFYNALGCPGTLHILFNALEECLKMHTHWKEYETELRAVGKIFAQKSYRDLVFQFCPGLGASEREVLCQLDIQLLDWRWESVESLAVFWQKARNILRNKWSEDSLGHTEKELARRLQAALRSEQNEIMTAWTCCLSVGLGKCARWLEGCYCHETNAAGSLCAWKGKRLCELAWDGGKTFAERMQHAGQTVFQEALLACSQELRGRMMESHNLVMDHLRAVLEDKFSWCIRLPFRIAGAFRLYTDKPILEITAFVRSCFQEFQGSRAKPAGHQLLDEVSQHLFGRESEASKELWLFAQQDEHVPASALQSLEHFPHAFVEVQERAWTPLAERYLEGQRRGIHWAFQRGFKKAHPPVTCARQRRKQILKMLKHAPEVAGQKEFVVRSWSVAHGMWQQLLGHLASKADIAQMTIRERLARCYCYSKDDHFPSNTEDQDHAAALFQTALRKKPD